MGRAFRNIPPSNVADLLAVAIALGVVARQAVEGYALRDVPPLLSALIGILGVQAVSNYLERRTVLRRMSETIVGMDRRLEAFRLGARASDTLTNQAFVPEELLRRAKRVMWSGVTLRTSLPHHFATVSYALEHGCNISILILDVTDSGLVEELSARDEVPPEICRGYLLSTELLLSQLPQGTGQLRLGTHRLFPPYGLVIIDPYDEDGVCVVELYHIEKARPMAFVITATTDSALFQFFVKQFEILHRRSKRKDVFSP